MAHRSLVELRSPSANCSSQSPGDSVIRSQSRCAAALARSAQPAYRSRRSPCHRPRSVLPRMSRAAIDTHPVAQGRYTLYPTDYATATSIGSDGRGMTHARSDTAGDARELVTPTLQEMVDRLDPGTRLIVSYHFVVRRAGPLGQCQRRQGDSPRPGAAGRGGLRCRPPDRAAGCCRRRIGAQLLAGARRPDGP
jgi:hypothetical protein